MGGADGGLDILYGFSDTCIYRRGQSARKPGCYSNVNPDKSRPLSHTSLSPIILARQL
jgi:hypothetical protein